MYSSGLRGSQLLALLAGPATAWPLVSAAAFPGYAAALLAASAADAPFGLAAGALARAAAGALPGWLSRGARALLSPHAVRPAPHAADARLGAALWAEADAAKAAEMAVAAEAGSG